MIVSLRCNCTIHNLTFEPGTYMNGNLFRNAHQSITFLIYLLDMK